MYQLASSFSRSFLTAIIAYSTHWGSVKLYNSICIPDGVWGYFGGMVSTASPICAGLCDIINASQFTYSSILLMSVSYIIVDSILLRRMAHPIGKEESHRYSSTSSSES